MTHTMQKSMQNVALSLFMPIGAILLIGLLSVQNARATENVASINQDHLKVATIFKMYAQDARNEGMEPILIQYADQELKAALELGQDYFDRYGMICTPGHDVLWDSQDPDYTQKKDISMTADGLVKVSLAQGSDIYYRLACSDTDCQVADLIMSDKQSLKEYLNEHCR